MQIMDECQQLTEVEQFKEGLYQLSLGRSTNCLATNYRHKDFDNTKSRD